MIDLWLQRRTMRKLMMCVIVAATLAACGSDGDDTVSAAGDLGLPDAPGVSDDGEVPDAVPNEDAVDLDGDYISTFIEVGDLITTDAVVEFTVTDITERSGEGAKVGLIGRVATVDTETVLWARPGFEVPDTFEVPFNVFNPHGDVIQRDPYKGVVGASYLAVLGGDLGFWFAPGAVWRTVDGRTLPRTDAEWELHREFADRSLAEIQAVIDEWYAGLDDEFVELFAIEDTFDRAQLADQIGYYLSDSYTTP